MAGDANVLVQVQRRFWNQTPEPKTPGRPADHPPQLGSRDIRHQAHDQTLGQVRMEKMAVELDLALAPGFTRPLSPL